MMSVPFPIFSNGNGKVDAGLTLAAGRLPSGRRISFRGLQLRNRSGWILEDKRRERSESGAAETLG
jgi:hypothetical protein